MLSRSPAALHMKVFFWSYIHGSWGERHVLHHNGEGSVCVLEWCHLSVLVTWHAAFKLALQYLSSIKRGLNYVSACISYLGSCLKHPPRESPFRTHVGQRWHRAHHRSDWCPTLHGAFLIVSTSRKYGAQGTTEYLWVMCSTRAKTSRYRRSWIRCVRSEPSLEPAAVPCVCACVRVKTSRCCFHLCCNPTFPPSHTGGGCVDIRMLLVHLLGDKNTKRSKRKW